MTEETKQIHFQHLDVRCECGAIIKGLSPKSCKANVIKHKKSKKHKELMEIREALKQEVKA